MPTAPIVEALTETNADTEVVSQAFQFQDDAPINRTETTDTNNPTGLNYAWAPGQSAHFDNLSLRYLAGKVSTTMCKRGYFLAQTSLNIATNTTTGIATLQVKILNEGPPGILDRIEVVGNKRNSREVLLNYLGLKPKMKFTSEIAADLENRLYHSARFLTNSILVGAPDPSGHLALIIRVIENDQCPPLNEPLTRVESTMLKTRDWLAKVGTTKEEAVLTVSGYPDETSTIQIIFAPQTGWLFSESKSIAGTNQLRHAVIISAEQVAGYATEQKQKYLVHFSTHQLKNTVTIETQAPDENGNCANMGFGAALNNLNGTPNAPFCALTASLAPAAFVYLAHDTNCVFRFDSDELTASNVDFVMKINAGTGRLVEFDYKNEKPDRTRMNLHFEPRAFAGALSQVEREGAGFVNVCQTNAPFGSAIAFFGSELMQWPFVDSFLRSKLTAATCTQLPQLLRQMGGGRLSFAV
jgi:hypothetical protein